jgi:uncharacterized protein (UPF0332 family)
VQGKTDRFFESVKVEIKTKRIEKEFGKIYSQLFTWRQKGDYDDLFNFSEEKVIPYFEPV